MVTIVGIIDSGEGGLAFLKGIMKPNMTYHIVVDKSFFPYGKKSKDFLVKRTIYLIYYLKMQGATEIILACNTLSALVLKEVKSYFKIPINGVLDLFNLEKKALFLGTTNTINFLREKYEYLIFFDATILIDLIEKKQDVFAYLKEKEEFFSSYQVILGCTHLIKIKQYFKNYQSQDELYLQSK